jgi:antitoxin component YwqK of YwqJK toxin-antitoxin module
MKKMKFLSCLISFIIVAILFSGCNGNSKQQGGLSGDSLKAGEKPVYSENGKLHFIVEYKDGKANGRVREYYPDGKLYMDAIYKDDHRHGKCIHYFKNGKPFSVSYYIDGAKDSIETKYNEKGQILAFVPYKNDKVQPGLKEFKKDGTELMDNTSLKIQEVNHLKNGGKYYLSVSLSEPRKNVKFYAAPQSDPESREILKISGDAGILNVPVSPGGFAMKKLIFEAEYRTPMGNTMRKQKKYNLAVNR